MVKDNSRRFLLKLIVTLLAISPIAFAEEKNDDKRVDDLKAAPKEALLETEGRRATSTPLPLSVTVSGGTSLGAYQAGYLYYLTETAKLNPDTFQIHLMTGASAGMINAVLTLLSMGNDEAPNPHDTLFYKLWTAMRYDELLDVEKAPPLAFSSRKVLEDLAVQVEKEWNAGLHSDLDMVLGATATRLKVYELEITDGFSIPRQEEKFIFRVRGRGKGKEPGVTNYVDRTYGAEQALLPFVDVEHRGYEHKRTNFSVIRQILFASSAIPILFLPQEIDFCMTEPNAGLDDSVYALRDCPEPIYTKEFVDGSMADRRPLRLAHRIARSGLIDKEGETAWRERPDLETGEVPDDVHFLYVDPSRHSYPELPQAEESPDSVEQATKIFPAFGLFMQGYLSSARAKEVATLIDENPEVRKRVKLVKHDFPTVSSLLGNFFGFFDREFRVFDFYLGMRDARRFVDTGLRRMLEEQFGTKNIEITYPDPAYRDRSVTPLAMGWKPYYCMRSQLDGLEEYNSACMPGEYHNIRALLQVSMDRLYNHCRQLPYDETVDHIHCKQAMQGESPPRIMGMSSELPDWKNDIESRRGKFEYTMGLLEAYDYHFKDLGLGRTDAPLAMSRIRSELQLYVDIYAKKLPLGERMAVRVLGKPAFNFFMYAPPETIVYLLFGSTAEGAVSATLGQSNWLRFTFSLQAQGLHLLLTESHNMLAFSPMLGLEAELYPLSSPLFQTRIGLRAGYQLATEDRFLTRSCDVDEFKLDSLACSAPVAQAFLAISFYERIRIQGGVEWFPKYLPPMSEQGANVLNGFVEVGWQWISPF